MKTKTIVLMGLLLWGLAHAITPSGNHVDEKPVFVYAQTNQTITNQTVFEVSLDWPSFKPTRISFNYPYTNRHSIKDITTIGNSIYKHTGGPTYLEFLVEDIDVFSFTVVVEYNEVASRTIVVGLFSGNEPGRSLLLKALCDTFKVNVRLSVGVQPTYPTQEEVAQEVVNQISRDLIAQQTEMRRLVDQVITTTYLNSIFNAIAVAAALVALTLAGFAVRRRKPDYD